MDDPCQLFFLDTSGEYHRRYEALRAYFVERRPLREIAQQFGYQYGTLRNLVSTFRRQCHAGQVPPFFENPNEDGPTTATPQRPSPKLRRSPIVAPCD